MGIYQQTMWSSLTNWLFGKPVRKTNPEVEHSAIWTRSLVLDLDTVIEAGQIMQRTLGGPVHYAIREPGRVQDREIQEADLRGLSAADRQRLVVQINRTDIGVNGQINFTSNPGIFINPAEHYDHLHYDVLNRLMENGQSRIQWKLVRRLFVFVPALAFLGSWIWLEAVQEMVPPAHVFGWLVVLIVICLASLGYRFTNRVPVPVPPHRIRMQSRAETAASYASANMSVKVVAITAPISIAGTLIVTFVTGLLNLPGS